jgi:hypothetical protein
MWLSVRVSVVDERVSVVDKTKLVERRTLCPCCGSRPRWAATVTRNDEIVEQDWWCPGCFAFIKSAPRANQMPQVSNHYMKDVPIARMN